MTLPQTYTAQGKKLELAAELGRGGEASVFLLKGEAKAVKLYHEPSEEKAAKLQVMLDNAPIDPTRSAGHISIAWPEALVHDQYGDVIGFSMPLLDLNSSMALHQLYNPKSRRQRAPALTWLYLVRIARNLCTVIAALHDKGYVIGDLNESNILVSNRALVSLVDCDSVQVKDGRKVYRCPVGKPEYTAPELQNKSFKKVTRKQNHDAFALSILLFFLLMEGVHPFAGVYKGSGDPPNLVDNIAASNSPYLGHKLKRSPVALPFEHLPRTMRRLFQDAFQQGLWRKRPTAKAWQEALEGLEQSLTNCSLNAQHVYANHLTTCPWCERALDLGLEAFPDTGQYTPSIVKPVFKQAFDGSHWAFIKKVPSLSLSTTLASGLLSFGLLQLASLMTQQSQTLRLSIVTIFLLTSLSSSFYAYAMSRHAFNNYQAILKLEKRLKILWGLVALIAAAYFLLIFVMR